jgi:hypothetical protein
MIFLALSCSEQGLAQVGRQDFFQQSRRNTVDVLLVVDNSCSMIEEQAKLATNFDSFIEYFDGADVSWQIGVVTTDTDDEARFSGHLIGGDDEIVLTNADDREQDRVDYDRSWTITPGSSYALDPTFYAGTANDALSAWCLVEGGSPGAVNASCGADEGDGVPDASDTVLITEFMADPAGVADEDGEWVELSNVTAEDQDVSGWHLIDNGTNAYTVPDGTTLAPGGTLLLARSASFDENGGLDADLALDDAFTLNNHDLYLTSDTEGPAEIFAEMVAQGTSGSGLEMGMEGARLALSEPLLSGDNAGFLREDANLSLLIVSDEEDSSPLSVDDYLNYFVSLKGDGAYRDHSLMNISAVVGDDPPEFEGEPACSSENGSADYGHRYVDAVSKTGGLLDSICGEDFSPLVSQLGLTLSGLEAEFELSAYPVLDTLDVQLYDSDEDKTFLRDLVLDVDYSYIEERNSLHFDYDQLPDSEQYISAAYRVQSGGAQ